jgi:hypothetical protein
MSIILYILQSVSTPTEMITGSRLLVLCGLLRMCLVHANCTACAPWQYETVPCSDSTDRVCANHTAQMVIGASPGCSPGQYWNGMWGGFFCYDCPAGTYSDGSVRDECHICSVGCQAEEYLLTDCSISHDRVCSSCTDNCAPWQYENTSCSPSVDRVCANCTECGVDYEVHIYL